MDEKRDNIMKTFNPISMNFLEKIGNLFICSRPELVSVTRGF